MTGIHLNGLCANTERIFFKNVVFQAISKEPSRSRCRYLTIKGCANMKNLDNTKMFECEQAVIIKTEFLRDNLKIFSAKL